MSSLRPVFLMMVASLLAQSAARADIQLPGGPPPPQAEAVTAQVARGGEASIELRGHSGGSGAVRFWIVRQPQHGKLSALRSAGENRASLIYTNDGHDQEEDGFSYCVEADGRISAPAEVHVSVEEPSPRLRAPEELDFGEVMAGTVVNRTFSLANEGGGILQGSLTISSPWFLASSAYQLGAGKSETIAVTFRPEEVKDFIGQITVSAPNGETRIILLHGSATAPLRIAPNPLSLAGQRRATVFLTNLTKSPLVLNFRTGAHFQPIETLEIAPREDGDISVEVAPAEVRPFQDTITAVGVHFTMPLRVDFSPPQAPVVARSAPSPAKPSVPPTPSPAELAPPTAAATESPSIDFAEKITARRLDSSRWELRWPAAQDAEATYRIEERQLALDGNDSLQISWGEIAAKKIVTSNHEVVAETMRLDPHQLHMVRVEASGADGTVLWESSLAALRPLPERSHVRAFLLFCLYAGLAGLLFFRWRGRRAFA